MKENIIKILVTGANGQLGKCLKDISIDYSDYDFHFKTSEELNITSKEQIELLFAQENFAYCVNCAAYTAVDNAENDQENAFLVNAEGVKYLAEACKTKNTILIHISTDFVFDGTNSVPYKESDIPNPINVYGASKLKGEHYIQEILDNYFILRTSWVYSKYGTNFVKTMLRLANERDELSVVCDQIGSPTYAGDLAEFILKIIVDKKTVFGLYHFTNEGIASWYDFAKAIFCETEKKLSLKPIKSSEYPTPAKRPKFSVMDKSKVKEEFNTEITFWEDSLKKSQK